jgi:broad specificity phosphatase PhoE
VTGLVLVRHGQATHNLDHRWEGWGSTPLTQVGQRQAEALARRLVTWTPAITQVCSSPLLRARQTAEPIARHLGLSVVFHSGLREIDFGQLSGLTLEEFCETMPQVYARWRNRSDMTFRFPGGEQRQAFFLRVGRALDEIIARFLGEQVVVVAHGGTLRAGMAHLIPGTMRDWWAYDLDNASLTHVRVGEEGSTLVALNDRLHLSGGRSDGYTAIEAKQA